MLKKCLLVCCLAMLLSSPFTAYAKDTSMRCGKSFISIGDSKSRILYHCGEPYAKEIIGYSKVAESEDKIEFIIDNWTYDISQSHFYIITFYGGRVVDIESDQK